MNEIEKAMDALNVLISEKVGLRNIHKTTTLPLAIQALQEKLDRERQPDGWISVGDRRPKEDVNVLVLCPDADEPVLVMYRRNNLWHDYCGCPLSGDVNNAFISHWMPLPKPPKEGK